MSELSKVISELNLPKQLLDKGEAVFKAVLGPSIREISETWGDSFKLRRFKNQVNILLKAQKILEEKNLDPKKVELKILVPMLEFSSLEEDENLQKRWANLIANIVTLEGNLLLKQNSLDILKKISSEEAKFLDHLFIQIKNQRYTKFEKQRTYQVSTKYTKPEDYPLHSFLFKVSKLSIINNITTQAELDLMLSNLVALGLVKWAPQVDVISAEKSYTDPDDTSLNIDIDIYDSESITITNLGYEFVKLCSSE